MKYKDLENEWSQYWFQFILDNPDKDWDWSNISHNLNITWEIIQQNPNIHWDRYWQSLCVSSNPNITWDIIRDNQDKPWNWTALSKNSMSKSKKEWINQRRLQHIKALQIQRHWRNCSCNPKFKLAQRILSKLYRS